MDNFNFNNEELVYIFNRLSREKEKMEEAMERKFVIHLQKNFLKEGVEVGAMVKPLSDLDITKIKNGTVYNLCVKLVEKLQPIAEVIMDADIEVKNKFENLL